MELGKLRRQRHTSMLPCVEVEGAAPRFDRWRHVIPRDGPELPRRDSAQRLLHHGARKSVSLTLHLSVVKLLRYHRS